MATAAARRPSLSTERKFFSSMAIALLITAFVGFAPTYFLMIPMHGRPLPLLVHLHGAAGTAWMLLLVTQTSLVAAGRRDLHRRMGVLGVALAAGIVVLGVMVALASVRHGRVNAGSLPPANLIAVQFTTIALFANFAALGFVFRTKAGAHKRLIILATISMQLPALARIARMANVWPLPPTAIGGLILTNLFLIALAVYDWIRLGRLHPVTLWGGLTCLICEPLRIVVGRSEMWHTFVTSVLT